MCLSSLGEAPEGIELEGSGGRGQLEPMRATLRDVAAAAGVSKGTVSRVLNGQSSAIRISAATEARVRHAARLLDYQPNAAAKALGRGRTETIAVVTPVAGREHQERRFSNLKISEALSGIDEATSMRGYSVLLQVATAKPFSDPRHRHVWNSGAVDGILWLSQPLDAGVQEIPLPVVAVNSGFNERPRTGWVNADDYAGSVLAMKHLWRLGHRRIAHIAGLPGGWNAQERLRAYLEFMAGAGREPLVDVGDAFEQSGMDAVARLLGNQSPPTAIFVAGDRMAFGALAELHARRLRVPEDLAVVGADGLDFVRFTTPRLTTVGMYMHEIARIAVEMLIDMIEGKSDGQQVLEPTELAIFDSCGFRQTHPGQPDTIVVRSVAELDAIYEPTATAGSLSNVMAG